MEMKDHLLGIHPTQLDKIMRVGKEKIWVVEWIQTLYDGPYQDVTKVLKMVSAETWKNYELLGITDQPEIHLLKKARLYLTKIWRETYPWSKKNVQSQTTQNVSSGMPCNRILSDLQSLAEGEQS